MTLDAGVRDDYSPLNPIKQIETSGKHSSYTKSLPKILNNHPKFQTYHDTESYEPPLKYSTVLDQSMGVLTGGSLPINTHLFKKSTSKIYKSK